MTATRTETTTDARLQAIFTDVLGSLLDVIRRHRVTWGEYRAATEWLSEAGNQGYEIPLLLDVFLSPTVDDVNFAAEGGTESNVEGPFYIADALPVREWGTRGPTCRFCPMCPALCRRDLWRMTNLKGIHLHSPRSSP